MLEIIDSAKWRKKLIIWYLVLMLVKNMIQKQRVARASFFNTNKKVGCCVIRT